MSEIISITGNAILDAPTIVVYEKSTWRHVSPFLVFLHHLGITIIPHLGNIYVRDQLDDTFGASAQMIQHAKIECSECYDD